MKLTRKKTPCEVPSVAMGDIAFNLLIFFVILARAQDDSHVQWEPATSPKVEQAREPKASVVVDKDKRIYLNGRQLGVAALSGELSKTLADAGAGKRTVLLKIHKSTEAALFEQVIEGVSEAGGEMLHVLEEKKPGK